VSFHLGFRQMDRLFESLRTDGPFMPDAASAGRRALANAALDLTAAGGEPEAVVWVAARYHSADNMTDRQAALRILADLDAPERGRAFDAFHRAWRHDPLMLDKWFTLQALSSLPDTLARVKALAEHEDFTLANPNRVRALAAAFAMRNPRAFHAADGGGYRFLAALAEQIAARAHRTRLGCFHEATPVSRMRGAIGLRQEHVDRLTNQLVAGIAELFFELAIAEHDCAVRTNDHDAARQGFGRESKELFSLAILLFG